MSFSGNLSFVFIFAVVMPSYFRLQIKKYFPTSLDFVASVLLFSLVICDEHLLAHLEFNERDIIEVELFLTHICSLFSIRLHNTFLSAVGAKMSNNHAFSN